MVAASSRGPTAASHCVRGHRGAKRVVSTRIHDVEKKSVSKRLETRLSQWRNSVDDSREGVLYLFVFTDGMY